MKKVLVLLFILTGGTIAAQNSNDIDAMRRQVEKQRLSFDSSMKRTDSLLMQQNKYFDSVNLAKQMEHNNRNLTGFMNSMKEREKKEKQRMWWRIGLGILFLAIGIFGIMRKRKAKKTAV